MTREEELERRLSLWGDLKACDTTDVGCIVSLCLSRSTKFEGKNRATTSNF